MISHLLIVIQIGHDGLGGATWVGANKLANLADQSFESCSFLTPLSLSMRHEPTNRLEPLSKIRWGFS